MSQDPSPSDFDRWEELLEQGVEPSEAAAEVGYSCSKFRRASTERHAAALTLSREARGYFADRKAEEWITEDEPSAAVRIAWLKRWNTAYRERHEVQVSGPDGGVVEVRVVHDEERATELARKLAGLGLVPAESVPGGVAGLDPSEPAGVDPAPTA